MLLNNQNEIEKLEQILRWRPEQNSSLEKIQPKKI